MSFSLGIFHSLLRRDLNDPIHLPCISEPASSTRAYTGVVGGCHVRLSLSLRRCSPEHLPLKGGRLATVLWGCLISPPTLPSPSRTMAGVSRITMKAAISARPWPTLEFGREMGWRGCQQSILWNKEQRRKTKLTWGQGVKGGAWGGYGRWGWQCHGAKHLRAHKGSKDSGLAVTSQAGLPGARAPDSTWEMAQWVLRPSL